MYEYKCVITRIVDGDTVDVDIDLGFSVWLKKQRIRLYGVDTPESRTSDKIEKIYGRKAKAFVQERLPLNSHQILRTKLDDSRGKFGRILGEFVCGESTVNQLLIDTHNGVEYFGQSKTEIEEAHLKNRKLLEALERVPPFPNKEN
jgi:micrococcal nuclease